MCATASLSTSICSLRRDNYLRLLPLALANPLPRAPRYPPLVAPPRPDEDDVPPRFDAPAILEGGTGGVDLGVALDEVGGLSTNDVSVVLDGEALAPLDLRRVVP